ncbi:MAG TPA: heavy metal translocating P-type ATPase, partial [Ruminococcaceae bacterium]|nr:heavy metal translocating P-type ATPase [Oscillospiraceae bacterium]
SFFGGIGGASRNGILIKGSNYLEALNRTETVVFDKTGTLTKGSFTVTRTAPASGFTEQQLLDYAAHAEGSSNHPIALSIRRAYGAAVDAGRVSEQEELAGRGVRVKVDGKTVLAGNAGMMEDADIPFETPGENGTVVFLAVDGAYAGYLVISDEIKPDSRKAIPALKKAGVKTIAMLTGDNRAAAEKTAAELGIDTVYAGLLPAQKVERLELLDSRKPPKGKLLFVGDGINDAPVLARADIGVAMGGIGSDAA